MKKFLAILSVFSMMLAFAACGKDGEAVETTTAETVAETEINGETAETTKISAVSGKTIMLKKENSQDYVEIKTNADGVATVMKVHKFFADDASFKAAVEKGAYGTYALEVANEAAREVIYSDRETVEGMSYDDILAKAETAAGYIIIPAA